MIIHITLPFGLHKMGVLCTNGEYQVQDGQPLWANVFTSSKSMILLAKVGSTNDWETRMHCIHINVDELVNCNWRWYGISIDLLRDSDVHIVTVVGRLADRIATEVLCVGCW